MGNEFNEKKFTLKNILFIDYMLSTKIITGFYWLLLLGALMFGLIIIFNSGFGFYSLFFGVIAMLIGAAFARISCESLILIFKINDNIQKLANKN